VDILVTWLVPCQYLEVVDYKTEYVAGRELLIEALAERAPQKILFVVLKTYNPPSEHICYWLCHSQER